jgi:hypothetical protein
MNKQEFEKAIPDARKSADLVWCLHEYVNRAWKQDFPEGLRVSHVYSLAAVLWAEGNVLNVPLDLFDESGELMDVPPNRGAL